MGIFYDYPSAICAFSLIAVLIGCMAANFSLPYEYGVIFYQIVVSGLFLLWLLLEIRQKILDHSNQKKATDISNQKGCVPETGSEDLEITKHAAERPEKETTERSEKEKPDPVQLYLSKRLPYLDIIKVTLAFLVVLVHSAESAGSIGVSNWSLKLYNSEERGGSLFYASFLLATACVPTLMSLFFFISGTFTMASFRRKTSCDFLRVKLKRLAIPAFVDLYALGPLCRFISFHAAGSNYSYEPYSTVTWFLTYLALYNIAFVLTWSATKSIRKGDKRIRDWFIEHCRFDSSLYLWILFSGFLAAFVTWAGAVGGFNKFLGKTQEPAGGIVMYAVYFYGGVYAGDQKWLQKYFENRRCESAKETEMQERVDSADTKANRRLDTDINSYAITDIGDIEANQKDTGSVRNYATIKANTLIGWSRYIFVLFYLIGLLDALYVIVLEGNDINSNTSPNDNIVVSCLWSVQGFTLIIFILDLACRKLKTINMLGLCAMQTAYAVYIIHPVVLACVTWLWAFILEKGLNVNFEFKLLDPLSVPTNINSMAEWQVWLSFFFLIIVTEAIAWPLAFFIRKLPLVNQVL